MMEKDHNIDWQELENTIRQNSGYQDFGTPPEGHFQRFAEKLDQYHTQGEVQMRQWHFRIAASAAVIAVSSALIVWVYFSMLNRQPANFMISQQSIEFREAVHYYSGLVAESELRLNGLTFINEKQRASFISDLDSMDQNFAQLENDLKKNPGDERVMNAMIEHYQFKVDIINQMIQTTLISESLEKTNYKNNRHEKNI